MIYDKAVAAVDKRINKLVDVQEELGKRIMSDLVDKTLIYSLTAEQFCTAFMLYTLNN